MAPFIIFVKVVLTVLCVLFCGLCFIALILRIKSFEQVLIFKGPTFTFISLSIIRQILPSGSNINKSELYILELFLKISNKFEMLSLHLNSHGTWLPTYLATSFVWE